MLSKGQMRAVPANDIALSGPLCTRSSALPPERDEVVRQARPSHANATDPIGPHEDLI